MRASSPEELSCVFGGFAVGKVQDRFLSPGLLGSASKLCLPGVGVELVGGGF